MLSNGITSNPLRKYTIYDKSMDIVRTTAIFMIESNARSILVVRFIRDIASQVVGLAQH